MSRQLCRSCRGKFNRVRGSCNRCYLIDFAFLLDELRSLKRRVRLAWKELGRVMPDLSMAEQLLDLRKPLPRKGAPK